MNKGVLYAFLSYAMWGFFPIFFHAINAAPAFQIVAHRVTWSFLLLAVVIFARKEFKQMRAVITKRTVLIYLSAAVLLAINWLVYVWAVNSGFVVEASLGYFINPMVSVLLGVVILRERLRPLQWLPVGLATAGVLYLTISLGALPWIALALASSFGLYGLLKKIAPLNSLHGLTLETTLLILPAFGYLLYCEFSGTGAFGHVPWFTSFLISLTGIVTVVPLLLFSTATRLVPLSTIGLIQYITPSMQFLMGVFVFKEPINHNNLIGFAIIWTALIIFSAEGLMVRRKTLRAASIS
jgi:chloramphenicol-sensitive protein RarD